MAATKFAIVIASETKAIRRAIYPDDDAELDRISLIKGETALLFSVKESGDLDQWKALVEKATGVFPPDPLCAVVKDGKTVSVIMADPKLDVLDGHELIELK